MTKNVQYLGSYTHTVRYKKQEESDPSIHSLFPYDDKMYQILETTQILFEFFVAVFR